MELITIFEMPNVRSICIAPNKDVYAVVYGGSIYKQSHGNGEFINLNQTSRNWNDIVAAPNGDIYASTYGREIYLQEGGIGDFIQVSTDDKNGTYWLELAVSPNGEVYAYRYDGSISPTVTIFKKSGAGGFISIGVLTLQFNDISIDKNGVVYLCHSNGIYKQDTPGGTFELISSTTPPPPSWSYLTTTVAGHVYAISFEHGIYKQNSGIGDFNLLSQPSLNWTIIKASLKNNVFVAVNNGSIYKQTSYSGEFTSLEVASKFWLDLEIDSEENIYLISSGFVYKIEAEIVREPIRRILNGDIRFEFNKLSLSGDIILDVDDVIRDPTLETAVYISLFTDRRAETSDLLPANNTDRRGFWYDTLLGSRLWLLEREKILSNLIPRAKEYCYEALQWMIDEKVASKLEIDCVLRASAPELFITIKIFQKTDIPQTYRYYYNWKEQLLKRG